MAKSDSSAELRALLDEANLSPDERRRFIGYLVVSGVSAAGGPQPQPIVTLLGTIAAEAGVREGDPADVVRKKIGAHFQAHPPPPRAMAALRAWLAKQPAAGKSLSVHELAALMIPSPTQNAARRADPPPEGSVPAGPLARFQLDDESS